MRRTLPILGLFSLALSPLTVTAPLGAGAEVPPPAVVTHLGLRDLRAEPREHLGTVLEFTLQFESLTETWNPWRTRFDPSEWLGFRAWDDRDFTWIPQVYTDPATRLFVRRGTQAERTLREAACYERYEVQAVLRETLLGEPWIEVQELRPRLEFVGEGTLLHVERARELLAGALWEEAAQQMDRALAAPLPKHAREELEILREWILGNAGVR